MCLSLLMCLANKGSDLPCLHVDGGSQSKLYQRCSKQRGRSCSSCEPPRHRGDQGGRSVSSHADLWFHIISRLKKTANIVKGGTAGKSVSVHDRFICTETLEESALAQLHRLALLQCRQAMFMLTHTRMQHGHWNWSLTEVLEWYQQIQHVKYWWKNFINQ